MSKKNIRIATCKSYSSDSQDWIEIDQNGVMFWKGEDLSDKNIETGFSFPVDIDFVSNFFKSIDRVLDEKKLPLNAILHPYAVNL